MNETSPTNPSIWKRPLPRWKWFVLLVGGSFLVLCGLGLLTGTNLFGREWGMSWALAALGISVVAVTVGTAVLLFLRWLCCWRNLRRFLFAVACLVTLIALFYAEENWRGKHDWQTYRRAWEAKGEKFDLASLTPPAVPDEKNFALTPLLKPMLDFTQGPNRTVWRDTNALAWLDKMSAELQTHRETNDHLVLGSLEKGTFADVAACAGFYRGNTNYQQAVTGAAPAEVILTALARYEPALKELREAAVNRPECRFPIQYTNEPSWAILLPHLAHLKAFTTLAEVRALAELEAGRPADAFEDLQLALHLSDSMREEPFLIDHLVRLATLGISLQGVREGLRRHAWSDAQLAQFESHLAGVDLLAEYKHAMRGERACTTEGLDYLRRQGFRCDPMWYLGSDEGGASAFDMPFNPMPGGWFYQNILTLARIHEQFMLPAVDEQAHRVFPDISEKGVRAVLAMPTRPFTVFAKMLLPALEYTVRKSARMQTYLDATRVACALERYRLAKGKLPETLAGLAPGFIAKVPNDVIDGQPLRYRVKPDGAYLLYSVGWNQTDDGGELAFTKAQINPRAEDERKTTVDITKGDWVWQMAVR